MFSFLLGTMFTYSHPNKVAGEEEGWVVGDSKGGGRWGIGVGMGASVSYHT